MTGSGSSCLEWTGSPADVVGDGSTGSIASGCRDCTGRGSSDEQRTLGQLLSGAMVARVVTDCRARRLLFISMYGEELCARAASPRQTSSGLTSCPCTVSSSCDVPHTSSLRESAAHLPHGANACASLFTALSSRGSLTGSMRGCPQSSRAARRRPSARARAPPPASVPAVPRLQARRP